MKTSIQTIREEIGDVENEIAYIENFKRPYLDSERSSYYMGHENGILYNREYVLRLRHREKISEETTPDDVRTMQEEEDSIIVSTPEESRHFFIQERFKPLIDLGIIK